ncbi:hypothetical protein ACE5IS_06500 [Leptospira wolffii]|uniref:Uncharacterized protein n=1 Tax=Leptospira wolffii TaxID=409998 RepID=A0ABV5BI84_9LEPT|nr:hypothetical protein [Leptospira wolffii]
MGELEKDINEITDESSRLNSEIDRIKKQASELRILSDQAGDK